MPNQIPALRIKLPSLTLEEKTAGNLKIVQMANGDEVIEVTVSQHANPKTYVLLDQFGRRFILKLPRASRAAIPDESRILRVKGIADISNLDEAATIEWEFHHRKSSPTSPQDIVETWDNNFRFIKETPGRNLFGLRQPQIGAIHSIGSHWSIDQKLATVVMPTGTGKTEVMLSTLIAEKCSLVLVIVPSNALREQTFRKFTTLGCLDQIGAITDRVAYPRVVKVIHGLRDAARTTQILDDSNVLVATAAILNTSSDDCLQLLSEKVTHLFIDEAHHTPAKTWTRIKDLLADKPILQFTATPFREDGKRLEGKFVYNFPLGLAQKNGYFKPINLLRINEIDDDVADRAIAEAAIEQLTSDCEVDHLDHVLMARVDKIERARELIALYEALGSKFNPVLIHSGNTAVQKRAVMAALESRQTRIVVCVGMLGEGYDLPNLKIAAIHDIHKSLPITLQFIGRFTRTSHSNIGDATVVVNMADPKVDKKLEALYAENPDWNELLRQKSESAIQREQDLQDVILNFQGELSKQVSLWNLRPSYSTLAYETNCEQWAPQRFKEILRPDANYWHAINPEENLLVIVISKDEEVSWGKYKDIKNLTFELCVVHWNKERQKLFIQCSDYDAFNCDTLAQVICSETATIFNGHRLFSIFAGINHPMVQNLGASKTGTISYTMYFGPEVTTGLSAIERAESNPNNIFAWGYEDGERVTYGCSARSGKIWSRGGNTIVDWKAWCLLVIDKIMSATATEAEIISGFLKPEPLNGRHESVALTVDWGEGILRTSENSVRVYFDEQEFKIYDIEIKTINLSETGPIFVEISNLESGINSEYSITHTSVSGAESGTVSYQHISGPVVSIKKNRGDITPLQDFMIRDPLIVKYVDGSFSYGNFHVSVPQPEAYFELDNIEPINWTVNIKTESEGIGRNTDSIQYQIIERIRDDYDIIVNDDGSGEVADIVAFRRESEDSYTMHFIHCKYSHTANPGADISNFYEVCGQAQKSIKWKHEGLEALMEHFKLRNKSWKDVGGTRFVKGDEKDLLNLQKFARFAKCNFKMTIVQPGLSKAKISADIIQLLGSTENYLMKTSNASLQVIASA